MPLAVEAGSLMLYYYNSLIAFISSENQFSAQFDYKYRIYIYIIHIELFKY